MNKKLFPITVCFLLLIAQACSAPTATPVEAPAAANTALPTSASLTLTPRPTKTIEPTPTSIPVAWNQISDISPFERAMITTITLDPQDSQTIYAGTFGSGIYRSTDGGKSWQPASNGLREMRIHSMVIDPTDTKIIYAGLERDGVYKSTDNGATWKPANLGIKDSGYWHQRLLISPNDSKFLYYVSAAGLYHTLDGGASWREISFPCDTGMTDLAIDPIKPDTLYVGYYGEGRCASPGLYLSTDNGRTWQILREFSTEESPVPWDQGLSMDPTGSYLYSIHTNRSSTMVLSYAPADQEWNNTSINCSLVVPNPGGDRTAYCGTTDGGIFITKNGGANWTFLSSPKIGPIKSMAFAPDDPSQMYVGGYGLAFSRDGGRTWEKRNSGLGSIFYEIKIHPETHDFFVHQWTNDNLVYQSQDNGTTWKMIKRNCRIDFAPNGIVYCWGWVLNNISYNNGRTWQDLQGTSPYWSTYTNPYEPNKAYSLADWSTGIAYTDNGSRTWNIVDATASHLENAAFFFASDQRTMYVLGTWNMYKSLDGKNWTLCNPIEGNTPITESRAAIHPGDSNNIFVATRGNSISMSRDGCLSWNMLSNLDGKFVNSILIDPQNPNTLYAGTDTGVYVSHDLGWSWGVINEGFLNNPVVYSIAMDKNGHIFAATPFGIFRLTDK